MEDLAGGGGAALGGGARSQRGAYTPHAPAPPVPAPPAPPAHPAPMCSLLAGASSELELGTSLPATDLLILLCSLIIHTIYKEVNSVDIDRPYKHYIQTYRKVETLARIDRCLAPFMGLEFEWNWCPDAKGGPLVNYKNVSTVPNHAGIGSDEGTILRHTQRSCPLENFYAHQTYESILNDS